MSSRINAPICFVALVLYGLYADKTDFCNPFIWVGLAVYAILSMILYLNEKGNRSPVLAPYITCAMVAIVAFMFPMAARNSFIKIPCGIYLIVFSIVQLISVEVSNGRMGNPSDKAVLAKYFALSRKEMCQFLLMGVCCDFLISMAVLFLASNSPWGLVFLGIAIATVIMAIRGKWQSFNYLFVQCVISQSLFIALRYQYIEFGQIAALVSMGVFLLIFVFLKPRPSKVIKTNELLILASGACVCLLYAAISHAFVNGVSLAVLLIVLFVVRFAFARLLTTVAQKQPQTL